MTDTFLHGVEVEEVTDGTRTITTVASAIIGIVGTAPDSAPEVTATLVFGSTSANTGVTVTSKLTGILGNKVSLILKNPKANSAALSVSVSSQAITVLLATGSTGAITTTAAQLISALTANTDAAALATFTATSPSTGAGIVAALPLTYLSGGADEAFPLNVPTIIAGSLTQAAKLGSSGTLPDALDSIMDQTGAVVVVVRVDVGDTDSETMANVIGGVNSVTGAYEGSYAFLASESTNGYRPRILIAPGFTQTRTSTTANAVVAQLVTIAERLRAVIVADAPSTTDADAVAYASDFDSKRILLVDPRVTKTDSNGSSYYGWSSAVWAGIICQTDNELGFWWSPSNKPIAGIVGTERSIDFALGDASSRANLLNASNVATIIHQNGYRTWGNRTLSSDSNWCFLSVVRTADILNDSLQRAHLWAVDQNITKTYVESVVASVNNYIRGLVAEGALIGGECFADPDLNTPSNVQQGKVYFDFKFTPPYPAEHITFQSELTNEYLSTIFS